jgi:hypothetical protein
MKTSRTGSIAIPLCQRRQNRNTYNFTIRSVSSTRWLHTFLPLYNRYMRTFLAPKPIYKSPGTCRSSHTTSDGTLWPRSPRSGGANPIIALQKLFITIIYRTSTAQDHNNLFINVTSRLCCLLHLAYLSPCPYVAKNVIRMWCSLN